MVLYKRIDDVPKCRTKMVLCMTNLFRIIHISLNLLSDIDNRPLPMKMPTDTSIARLQLIETAHVI